MRVDTHLGCLHDGIAVRTASIAGGTRMSLSAPSPLPPPAHLCILWYSRGEISQSKAAEIAGTSRAEFIDEFAHGRIPVAQVTAEELLETGFHRE